MTPFWRSIGNRCLNLLYPPTCLHCLEGLDQHVLLCSYCLQHLTLLSKEGRCTQCFGEIPKIRGVCKPCRERRFPVRCFSSCFEGEGPAQTLLRTFAKGGDPFLAKELAAYLVIQLDRLSYPCFDLITIIPDLFSKAPLSLGKEVAKMLGCPFSSVLRRYLSPEPMFSLKNRCRIVGKNVLLIGLEAKTRQTIRLASLALEEGEPETIYGITACVK